MKRLLLIIALVTIAVTLALVKCGEQEPQTEAQPELPPVELICSAETAAAGPSLEIRP